MPLDKEVATLGRLAGNCASRARRRVNGEDGRRSDRRRQHYLRFGSVDMFGGYAANFPNRRLMSLRPSVIRRPRRAFGRGKLLSQQTATWSYGKPLHSIGFIDTDCR
jgi:hypothetical protein